MKTKRSNLHSEFLQKWGIPSRIIAEKAGLKHMTLKTWLNPKLATDYPDDETESKVENAIISIMEDIIQSGFRKREI